MPDATIDPNPLLLALLGLTLSGLGVAVERLIVAHRRLREVTQEASYAAARAWREQADFWRGLVEERTFELLILRARLRNQQRADSRRLADEECSGR